MIKIKPRVSLLIPCFKSEKFISFAIDSALNQTYGHIEIIIAPDDLNTYSFLREKYNSPQLRIIKPYEKVGTGPGETRNRAIDASTGEFITMLDADDIISAEYIEKLMQVALINGASLGEVKYSLLGTNEIIRIPPFHKQCLSLSGFGQLLCSSHPLIHRSLETGYCSGFAEDVIHDALVFAKMGTIDIVKDVFYDIKIRRGSETNKGKDAESNIILEYQKKIDQIFNKPTQLGIQSLNFQDKYDLMELFKFRAYVSEKFGNQTITDCYHTWVNGKEAILWDEYSEYRKKISFKTIRKYDFNKI